MSRQHLKFNRRHVGLSLLATALPTWVFAQNPSGLSASDIVFAETLRDTGLQEREAYALIESLVTEVGARPAGSTQDDLAVQWAIRQFKRLGLAQTRAEPVPLQTWRRGAAHAHLVAPNMQPLVVTTLGNSVGTERGNNNQGIEAELAYYENFDALKADTSDKAKGRIVFVNNQFERSMDGSGYGKVVPVRFAGANEASKRGALAFVIRSIGTDKERFAHTGAMGYDVKLPAIPALAVSTPDAEQIARLHARGLPIKMHLHAMPRQQIVATSHNVIAEITGTDLAHEVVLLGAHLDSWDIGQGAQDDGAGVGIVAATMGHLLRQGAKPRRTIRAVLFANEENGFDGANAYAARYETTVHQFVSESDFGAGRVWRMRSRVRAEALPAIEAMGQVLAPLGIVSAGNAGQAGPDAGVLSRKNHWPMMDLTQDGTNYFDIHHTENDTLEKIDPATLPQNVAAWSVVAWLAAQTSLKFGSIA